MSFQVRGTLRPLPMVPILKGLRLTGFYDDDHYAIDAKKQRYHRLRPRSSIRTSTSASSTTSVKDQTSAAGGGRRSACATRSGSRRGRASAWKRSSGGTGSLPTRRSGANRQRLIAGPAYWFPVTKSGVAAAVLLRFEQLRYMGAPNSKPTEESYGLFTALQLLVNTGFMRS